jgi:hypothetical protein
MERQHPHQGGEFQDAQVEQQPAQPGEHLTDAHLVHYGITEALREQRAIDHATARVIASQLHGGQASSLYVLASSGALLEDLRDELGGWRREDTPVELEPWLDALDESQLWPTGPRREDDEPDTG